MKKQKITRDSAYKWVVIASGFLMIFVALGFCSSNKGMYLSAITEALGMKRSLFSINDSFRYAATAVVNLFFGTLIQKAGVKKLVGAGFLSLIISTAIYAYATNIFVFYIGGCFLGIGLSWTTTTMASYLVNRWCPEKRGVISGLVLSANGFGGALAAQIITPFIYDTSNPFGYRKAYYLVIVLLAVTGVVLTILIREPNKEPDVVSAKKKKINSRQWTGISFQEALRHPYFYAAAICVFITGMVLQGINGVAAAQLEDAGVPSGFIATAYSALSLALTVSKFQAGLCYDKFGLWKTLIICQICASISFVALALANASSFGMILAVIWGVVSAFALPLETVMVPLIAADLFGDKDFTKTVGIFVSINTAGFAFGTPICNLVYDIINTYTPVLFVCAAVMLLMVVAFGFIIRASNREKLRIMSEVPDKCTV